VAGGYFRFFGSSIPRCSKRYELSID
jgi:hypothetical protein